MIETSKPNEELIALKAGALCVSPTKEPSTPTILGVNPILAAIRTELLAQTNNKLYISHIFKPF